MFWATHYFSKHLSSVCYEVIISLKGFGCGVQLATEQAQSLEASLAAEERIQALEQRLAAQQEGSAVDQAAAGDPPAMAAPGTIICLASLQLLCKTCCVGSCWVSKLILSCLQISLSRRGPRRQQTGYSHVLNSVSW